jgi:hypothetical protein
MGQILVKTRTTPNRGVEVTIQADPHEIFIVLTPEAARHVADLMRVAADQIECLGGASASIEASSKLLKKDASSLS